MEATSTPPPLTAVESALALIDRGLTELRDADPSVLGTSVLVDSFDQLLRLRRKTEAAYLRLLGEVDTRKVATDVGAKSTAEWLRLRHQQNGSVRDVTAARAIGPDGDLTELGAGAGRRSGLPRACGCRGPLPGPDPRASQGGAAGQGRRVPDRAGRAVRPGRLRGRRQAAVGGARPRRVALVRPERA